MAKFLVELYLDGYETEEEMNDACLEFIEEQLNFSASSVKVTPINDNYIKPKHGEFYLVKNNYGEEVLARYSEFYFPPDGAFISEGELLSYRPWKENKT